MPRWVRAPRPIALSAVAAVYVAALGASALVILRFPHASIIRQLGAASFTATLAVFAGSMLFDNSSVFDPYWSVAPMAAVFWLVAWTPAPGARAYVALGLTAAWGARLTWNWVRGWRGMDQEDFRYVDLRAQSGGAYWLVSLLGVHLFPALLVWLGSWSLTVAVADPAPLGWLDALGVVIAAGAIVLETIADRELRAFVTASHEAGAVCWRGPWAWSRHPNYLGEIGFWWGLFLLALGADRAALWCAAGPVAITLLFNVVSIPMMEKHMTARHTGYAVYQRRVSRLLPAWRKP